MKIKRLNEDVKRFYVDEIVSAPGGKTETERHSFATIDELKQYCKDAGLTKDEIANCGGCDIKDLYEDADKQTPDSRVKLEVKYEVYGRYGTGGQVKKGRISGSDEVDALMNMLDHVHMYIDSDFADEFEEENGRRPTTEDVVDRLYSQNGDGCDLIYYITNLTTGNMIFDGGVEEEEDWDNLDESTDSKLYTKPNGEYLVKADSGKGYTAFSRDNVAIGGIDNEDADSDDKAIDKFKRNEYSECLNEAYFDTAEYRIQKYEDDIPELMAGMHDAYMEGKLDAVHYAEVLKKVYDALAECDYKYSIDECSNSKISDKEELNEAINSSALMGIISKLSDTYGKLVLNSEQSDKILVSCGKEPTGKDATFDEVLSAVQDVVAGAPLVASALTAIAEAIFDAYMTCVTLGLIVCPFEGNAGEIITALIKAVPLTAIVSAIATIPAALINRFIFIIRKTLRKSDADKVEQAAKNRGITLDSETVDVTEEFEYDDNYSMEYDMLIEECSGIRAHKVMMGNLDTTEYDDTF